jgi:hypothetical protein
LASLLLNGDNSAGIAHLQQFCQEVITASLRRRYPLAHMRCAAEAYVFCQFDKKHTLAKHLERAGAQAVDLTFESGSLQTGEAR